MSFFLFRHICFVFFFCAPPPCPFLEISISSYRHLDDYEVKERKLFSFFLLFLTPPCRHYGHRSVVFYLGGILRSNFFPFQDLLTIFLYCQELRVRTWAEFQGRNHRVWVVAVLDDQACRRRRRLLLTDLRSSNPRTCTPLPTNHRISRHYYAFHLLCA